MSVKGFKNITKLVTCIILCISLLSTTYAQEKFSVKDFEPVFTVLYTANEPNLAMRPANIPNVKYNVASWKTFPGKTSDLTQAQRDEATAGDGFDDKILEGKSTARTVDHFNAAEVINIAGKPAGQRGDTLFYEFPDHDLVRLKAYLIKSHQPYPLLHYEFVAKKKGWYSAGYTGAPASAIENTDEIWQPLIWQEKRFPDKSYLTLAFRSPLPTALVTKNGTTIGVLAKSSEFPFNPLPMLENSRFGIAVRNHKGEAQPQLWAPVLGGINSKMQAGQTFKFDCLLPIIDKPLITSYEEIARKAYDFKSYRTNAISNLNDVIERMTDYAMSDYAWFIDSLKGCAYSTDVPGAVKNVSSLNPINMSIVMDNAQIFEKRGYPIMEYMLSREKFLFALDKEQKIQNPSRKLTGPVAPVSELGALYEILGKSNGFLLNMAEKEFNGGRIRNLDVEQSGDNWMNALYLFKATKNKKYLDEAKSGADRYLRERVNKKQAQFNDPFAGGYFFWPAFTNRWIELLELYELTGEKKYLDAARDGARHYTQFTWMSPAIPDKNVTVNKGGVAPMYWYLKAKGHKQMYFPEEQVPAWRLSEIGLTPESSGTSTGHRAIFMANYAPWMLRLGYYANDKYLQDVAKDAIVGRYRNFPGYHINTARTTAYEKADYPLHKHEELSINSFHYNHIMPMISLLLDYLVTDAFVKSGGKIDFPSDYIEGYAYLQSKMYGHQKGIFYGERDVQLWMPKNLIAIDNVELNYIAGRKDDRLFLAFMNQSDKAVTTKVTLNRDLVKLKNRNDYTFSVTVPPGGITHRILSGAETNPVFQDALLAAGNDIRGNNYLEIPTGNAKAMLFRLGDYGNRAYIYLSDDDSRIRSAKLSYRDEKGKTVVLKDDAYPYEFTVSLPHQTQKFTFNLETVDVSGKAEKSGTLILGKTESGSDKPVKSNISEFNKRGGLGNFLKKAKAEKNLTIGYIGGSITRSEIQYRGQTTAFLKSVFPESKIVEINAGVSGTDADLGACRIEEQLLADNPDLIFIEFAVNGGFAPGVEGMVRKIWKRNPHTDICFIYTVRAAELQSYIDGKVPPVIAELEKIAAHYQIPSVHLGLKAAELLRQGKLIAKGNPQDESKRIVFSQDGTHPTEQGGNLYAEAIKRAFENFQLVKVKSKKHNIPEPLFADNWEDAHSYAPEKIAEFSGNWQKIDPAQVSDLKVYKAWFPSIMKTGKPGDSFTIRFKGSMIGLFDIGGPEVGQLDVRIDGEKAALIPTEKERWKLSENGKSSTAINRFNRFCNNRHRGQYFIIELPDKEHEVTFTVSSENPDKRKILGIHQLDDIQKNPDKYAQSVIYAGKVLLRGKLLK